MTRKLVCRLVLTILGLFALVPAAPVAAWHGSGHHRATQVGVNATPKDMPSFFTAGAKTIAHCSLEPDMATRPLAPEELHKAESSNHYMDIELLGGADIPRFRYDLIKWCIEKDLDPTKVGQLPYAITEWTHRLSVALAEHRRWPENEAIRAKCLVYAGMAAHYAADLCQPLHTTVHYDGRIQEDGTSPRSGIHLKVDALIGKLGDLETCRVDAAKVRPYEDLFEGIVAELKASHELVARVYELEDKIPDYDEPLKGGPVADFTAERLRASGRFVARLYATAWRDSAKVEMPKWHIRPADKMHPTLNQPDYRLTRPAEKPRSTGRAVVSPAVVGPKAPVPAAAKGSTEEFRVATWNIEHLMRMFDQEFMPRRSRDMTEYFRDDEDLYEIARTLKLPEFSPDILAVQECCNQDALELLNKERLDGAYAFVKVFPGNTEGQYLAMLAKPGYEVLEVRDQYYKEADPVRDPDIRRDKQHYGFWDDNRLFCRGPAFVKFRTPGGSVLWVGCTHVKSKYNNNPAVTRWRIRELKRTREICLELAGEEDTDKVILLGDFNDSFGKDRDEETVGADAIAAMLDGKGKGKLTCLALPLIKENPKASTYHCEIKPPKYRSFIDMAFATPALAEHVVKTWVVDAPVAAVASDHYPVVTLLRLPVRAAEKSGNE